MFLQVLLVLSILSSPIVPPGTVNVGGIYVDKTEVQNFHWIEYMVWQSQTVDKLELRKILPDTANNWYNEPDKKYEPITHISYEQAVAFCEWRSKVVSEKMNRNVVYRLPTELEWRKIALAELSKNGRNVAKEIKKLNKKSRKDKALYQTEDPQKKVYDLFWNVSEMTSKKGLALGPHSYQKINEHALLEEINYSSSSAYLGFRCVAEIK